VKAFGTLCATWQFAAHREHIAKLADLLSIKSGR
jgi:hypothetical protein